MVVRKSTLLLGGLALSLATGAVSNSSWAMPESSWDNVNAPTRLESGFTNYFDETGLRIPLTSHVPVNMMPYADTYWPANRGGIAYRWHQNAWVNPSLIEMAMRYRYSLPTLSQQTAMDTDTRAMFSELMSMTTEQRSSFLANAQSVFSYRSPTREEALRMSPQQLEMLSPTEKYDLALGHYNYPMTNDILGSARSGGTRRFNSGRAYWEGICHGWAPASVNHAEPQAVTVTNSDGIAIPFGSADVKAILDYLYATVNPHVRQMGKRCSVDLTRNPNSTDEDCSDVNPGAFHIVMTNYIGLRHQAFVADVSRGNEVWNNAIYAYSSEIKDKDTFFGPVRGSAEGTHHRKHIVTKVRYPSDDERLAPQWNPTVGQPEMLVPETSGPIDAAAYENTYRYEEATYEYWLEIDANNQILGGEWISFEHPDYVWMKNRLLFTGDFEGLNRIYRPAQSR